MFTDTHCHLYKEYYKNMSALVKKCVDNKIPRFINNGTDMKSNKEVLNYVFTYEGMYGALGIHPESVEDYKEEDIEFIREHINDDKIVAIGEIGLDYHWVNDNKDKQIELFEKQLQLAEEYDKPVIIHSRDATEDTINTLKKHHVRGVIHSFSGSYETAMIYIKMGFLLGINGVITFKNCKLKDVVLQLGLENFVLETDSPYLTPVPFRGESNDPSHIMDIAKYICDLKDISLEELSKITEDNVKRIYNI
ncbi:MAG: TatD family hydrolase [Bacilli bacterium]|nr:TatD family hydrolase [Bacilli bacterium]